MLEFRDKLSPEERVAIAKPSIINITVRGDAHFFREFDAFLRSGASQDEIVRVSKEKSDVREQAFRKAYAWMPEAEADARIHAQSLIFYVEMMQAQHGCLEKTKVSRDAARLICDTRLQVEPEDLMHLLEEHPLYLEGDPLLYDNVMSLCIGKRGRDITTVMELAVGEHLGTISGVADEKEIDWNASIIDADEQWRAGNPTPDAYLSQIINALTYCVRYLLLLKATKTPIESEIRNYDGSRIKGPSHGRTYIPQKYVSLTKEYIRARKDYETGVRGELDKYGKHLKPVEIAGFVRMQAYGEGHKLRRPQFIPGFASSRWENDGIKIINVKP